jgi:benzoyl-CoA reductase subunit A
MRCFVGIDLGSTTTKSVVLDEQERVVGRGITNSRSNYEVACTIARSEAFANVRLSLCERAIPAGLFDEKGRARFVSALERAFRLAWHRARLTALGAVMVREIPAVERLFGADRLERHVVDVLARMDKAGVALFQPGAARRSEFFRDLATAQYHDLAAESAKAGGCSFEALMAVFDKAILKADNERVDFPVEDCASSSIDHALLEVGIRDAERSALAREPLRVALTEPLEVVGSVGTGYGRATLPFPREQIRSEILCHGLGAHAMFPRTATVLDIGGQDTKAIQVDRNGIVTSFQMNDRCAAGCGRYLGYIADEMNLGLHELGPLAEKSKRTVKINSTCTVFAGAEIRDRLTLGQKREDILAGLHRAVILRAMSLVARSGGIKNEFTFTGGVAKNVTAVRVLAGLATQNYGDLTINVSPDSIYTGALGAALFAHRAAMKEVVA